MQKTLVARIFDTCAEDRHLIVLEVHEHAILVKVVVANALATGLLERRRHATRDRAGRFCAKRAVAGEVSEGGKARIRIHHRGRLRLAVARLKHVMDGLEAGNAHERHAAGRIENIGGKLPAHEEDENRLAALLHTAMPRRPFGGGRWHAARFSAPRTVQGRAQREGGKKLLEAANIGHGHPLVRLNSSIRCLTIVAGCLWHARGFLHGGGSLLLRLFCWFPAATLAHDSGGDHRCRVADLRHAKRPRDKSKHPCHDRRNDHAHDDRDEAPLPREIAEKCEETPARGH